MDDADAYLAHISNVKKSDIKIDREKLFKLYMKRANKITNDCDWITHITPEMLVGIVSDVIEEHHELLYKK